MKTVSIILILTFWCIHIYCQDSNKKLDFIIVIDDNIATGSISTVQLKTKTEGEKVISANYYPGSLELKNSDYTKLMSESGSIYLTFVYHEYDMNTQKNYSYELELKKPWFSDYYNIIRIYNLDKKKYKNKYKPLDKNRNYNFELESPSNSFKLVEKK